MPFIEAADGTSLFFKDWGAGKPLVFIHGWPLNADITTTTCWPTTSMRCWSRWTSPT